MDSTDKHAEDRDLKRKRRMVIRGRSLFTIVALEQKREGLRKDKVGAR